MSLGVKRSWQVCSRLLSPGQPLIPRECSASKSHQDRRASLHNATHTTPAGAKPTPAPEDLLKRLENVPVRPHGRESIVVAPPTTYPHRAEIHHSNNKYHRATTAQHRHERARTWKRVSAVDWRLILQFLNRWTQRYDAHRSDETIKVMLSTQANTRLLSDNPELAIGEIVSRTGCSAEVQGGDDGTGRPSILEVAHTTGADPAAAGSVGFVPLPKNDLSLPHPALPPLPKPKALTPRAGFRARARAQYLLGTSADMIPRPAEWTKTSFEHYVSALVSTKPVPNMTSRLYPKNVSHEHAVIANLHRLFTDPESRAHISDAAFKMSLSYMLKAGSRYLPDARALFIRMETIGLFMDTSVFNLFAEAAAVNKDLSNFQKVVQMMVARGHRPDLRTWILFLNIIEAEEVRRHILHSMQRLGLFSAPWAMMQIAGQMAGHDAHRFIQQGKDFATFLKEQEEIYGPRWLGFNAANRVLDVLGRHGRFDDMTSFLELMFATPTAKPNTATLMIALTHCRLQNNLYAATRFLALFDHHHGPPRYPNVYTALFQMAYRHKKIHTLDFVWRYACMRNLTTYRMRLRAAKIVAAGTPFRDGSRASQRWALDVPAVSLGPRSELRASVVPAGALFTSEMVQKLGPRAAGDMLRKGKNAVAIMTDWYAKVFAGFDSTEPFYKLWSEALEMDKRAHETAREGGKARLKPISITLRRDRSGQRAHLDLST